MRATSDASSVGPTNAAGSGDATCAGPTNAAGSGDATCAGPTNAAGSGDATYTGPRNAGESADAPRDESSQTAGNSAQSQWHVLLATWLGGVFDGMDSSIFAIILFPALSDLLGT